MNKSRILLINQEFILQLLKCSPWKLHTCKKKTLKNFDDFFPPKLLHPKFELNLFFGYPNQLFSVILTLTVIIYVYIYLSLIMEAFNNLDEKQIVKVVIFFHGRACEIFWCVKIYLMFFNKTRLVTFF